MDFQKLPPKIVNYWDYENFGNKKFRLHISKFDFGAPHVEGFKNTTFCIFNKHASTKRKYVLANEVPFMTKELHTTTKPYEKIQTKT